VRKLSLTLCTVFSLCCLPLQSGCGSRNYEKTVESLDGKTVIRIDLSNTKVTDTDLAGIEFPDSLQAISLANTAITDVGVKTLLDAKNLEQVDLENTQITPASMEILEQLPKLQVVNIAGENVSPSVAFDFYKKIVAKNPGGGLGNKASIKLFKPMQQNPQQSGSQKP